MKPWEKPRQQAPWEKPRITASETFQNVQPGAVLPLPGVGPAPSPQPELSAFGREKGGFLGNLLPTQEGREFIGKSLSDTVNKPVLTPEQYQGIKDHIEAAARTVGHGLLPSLVGKETPEQGEMFDSDMKDVSLMLLGGVLTRVFGVKMADALKYLGRGFRTPRGAESFVRREGGYIQDKVADSDYLKSLGISAKRLTPREILSPALSGSVIGAIVDYLDPTSNESGDAIVSGAAGLGTSALVAKNTIDDLLVNNPRWRKIMMRPSKGTASAILGAILGYGASRGLDWTVEKINDAANWVADLFDGEEGKQ